MTNKFNIKNIVVAISILTAFALVGGNSVMAAVAVPTCEITVIPTVINNSQQAILKWNSTEGAIFASIDNGIGDVSPDGQLIVSPSNTTVYTMHTWNSQGEGGFCSTELIVNNGTYYANNVQQPTVNVSNITIHSSNGGVILSNVPYTGFDDVINTFFLFALILTSIYAIINRKYIFS